MPLLDIADLHVSFPQHDGLIRAVRGVSLSVGPGQSLGIVGESGSGKSVTCMAVLRLLREPPARITAQRLRVGDTDMLHADRRDLTQVRGRQAAMVFQDPMTAFDSVFTIGHQIVETIRTHREVTKADAMAEAEALLARVKIKNPGGVMASYPHQLSGGMLQRAMIAMALSCRPQVLIADEPTTALDVTIQAQILALIKELQAEFGMALVMITHDLGVIAETVDHVVVMFDGQVMETAPVADLFDAPTHSYTRTLLAALDPPPKRVPASAAASAAPDAAAPPAALELQGLTKDFTLRTKGGWWGSTQTVRAVDNVSLTLPQNGILGLVGESGSGKTTTGMMALRLTEPTAGRIILNGTDITTLPAAALKAHRRTMQVVFQDSYSALDPSFTLRQIVAEPLVIHDVPGDRARMAADWLDRVGLGARFADRYPHELSGGQRQRVAIARALILEPKVLVADEPTSALDVSIKGQIINLLLDLQAQMGLAILFISHDLSVVRSLTDRVAVMWHGRVVEQAPTEALFSGARHPYTQSLLDAIPATHPRLRRARTFLTRTELERRIPAIRAADLAGSALAGATPQLVQVAPGHLAEVIVT